MMSLRGEGGQRRDHKVTGTKEEDGGALGVCMGERDEGGECYIEGTEVVLKDTTPRSKLTIEATSLGENGWPRRLSHQEGRR